MCFFHLLQGQPHGWLLGQVARWNVEIGVNRLLAHKHVHVLGKRVVLNDVIVGLKASLKAQKSKQGCNQDPAIRRILDWSVFEHCLLLRVGIFKD